MLEDDIIMLEAAINDDTANNFVCSLFVLSVGMR